MAVNTIRPKTGGELRGFVEAYSHQKIARCYQCGKCTAGCPVAYTMDLTPRQVMRALQLGIEDELKRSSTMWICFYCITCSARCPREIDIARVMEALRLATGKEKVTAAQKNIKLFHELFLRSVKYWGRAYELGLALTYNLLSKHPLARIELGPGMLFKGKLALLPHLVRTASEIRVIFARIESLKKETSQPQGDKS